MQKDALLELLETKDCRDGLSCEQRALLQDLIMEAPYGDDDKSQCLISLAGGQRRKPRRTKQQDATHCLEYLSEKEWQLFPRMGQLGVLQLLFDVLISRMQCFNPTEGTLKWVASSVIFITTPKDQLAFVTEGEKKQMQKGVRRKLKQFQKNTTERPIEHCLLFPSNPHALEQKHPALFAHIQAHIGGSFTANQLCASSLMQLDQSYQCRGGGKATSCQVMVEQKPPDGMQTMMAMMSMLLQKQRGDSLDDEDEPRLKFTGKKRCLLALAGDSDRGESELRRARTVGSLELKDAFDTAVVPSESAIEQPSQITQPAQIAPPSQSSIAQFTAPSADLNVIADRTEFEKASSKPEPTSSASLLDALMARDAERAQVSKDKAAAKRADAKLEKEKAAETAKLEKGNVKAAETVQKKKPGKGSGSGCCNSVASAITLTPPKKDAATKQGKLTAVKNPKPSMSHESTRMQYLVRTGVKGAGQSSTFKYGAGMSQQDAKAAAEKKVSELACLKV